LAVWTVSAEVGTGAERIAAALAEAAGAELLDRPALLELAHELQVDLGGIDDVDELEARAGGRLNLVACSMAILAGSGDAVRALQEQRALPELVQVVAAAAAGRPCVILAPGAFAALPLHHTAVHARLHAPFAWRVAQVQRERLIDRRHAEKAVRHDDRARRHWVHGLFGVDVTDCRQFTVSVDASRLPPDRIVELLLAAAGVPDGQPVAS
jgi:cytidylate kinase